MFLMRDEKEVRKKEASKVKQGKATQHTQCSVRDMLSHISDGGQDDHSEGHHNDLHLLRLL